MVRPRPRSSRQSQICWCGKACEIQCAARPGIVAERGLERSLLGLPVAQVSLQPIEELGDRGSGLGPRFIDFSKSIAVMIPEHAQPGQHQIGFFTGELPRSDFVGSGDLARHGEFALMTRARLSTTAVILAPADVSF